MAERKLTAKQEAYKNARIAGKDPSAAYDIAYPTHKMSRNSVNRAAQEMESHPIISPLIQEGREQAAERAIVTTEDVVKGLLVEAQCNGEGSSQSARVAAWKALSDFTGGFDSNKQKQEVSGPGGSAIENKWTVEIVSPEGG